MPGWFPKWRPAAVPVTPTRWATVAEAVALVALAWLCARGPLAGWPGASLPALAALVVGARAGYVAGLAAGGAAAALALVQAGLAPGDLLSPIGARGLVAPVAIGLGLGALGGLVGDAHRTALARARGEAEGWRKRHDELKVRHDVMVAAKEAQDRRVVGQFHTFSTLYEAAKALDVLEPREVLPATARLARDLLEADTVAIYVREGDRLVLAEALGDRPDRPATLPLTGTLAGEALRAGEVQAWRAERGTPPDGWLAAPLASKQDPPQAVVVVERLAFLRLTPDAMQLLGLLADWAGRALATSEAHARARAQQVLDPITGVHQAGYMLVQLQREWDLAARYGLPLSLLLVRRPALSGLEGAARDAAVAALAGELRGALRQIDPVGHYRVADAFLAILPVTPPQMARGLAERLRAAMPETLVACAGNDEGATPEDLLQALQRATDLSGAGA